MAGYRGAGRGQGGRGNNKNNNTSSGRGGRGGRGNITRGRVIKTGLNKDLEGNIFDLGERSSADLMRTTQIKIAQYIGTLYGGDIMGELETKTEFVAATPEYPQSVKTKQAKHEIMVRANQRNKLGVLERKESRLKAKIAALAPTDVDGLDELEEQLVDTENEIRKTEYEIASQVEAPMTEEEKAEWRQSMKAYGDRCTKHVQNQQKAFAIIIGQCTQRLQDKLHDDAHWEQINKEQKPLELYTLIEKVVMKQTGDEYPPQNLVENLLAVLTLKQQTNQSNAQWYEKLNTRVDVAESVGVQFDSFSSLWDYCCEAKSLKEYDTLTSDEQATIRAESKERLLAYLLIVNSSSTSTHESVKNNLLDAFIAKRDEYPETRTDAIALLNKYDERKQPPAASSEGTAFAQKEKKKGKDKKKETNDTKDDKSTKKSADNIECFICNKKGHYANKCPMKPKVADSDDSTISSNSSKRDKLEELKKEMKRANKQFTLLKASMENDDDSSDDDEQSHFQFLQHFSLVNHFVTPDIRHNEVSLKQSRGKLSDIDLRQVILLDNQSTMSLFCNKRLVKNIQRSPEPLILKSNGGSMTVHEVASIGKKTEVWFSRDAITNILSVKDVMKSYRITYDSYDKAFIVWREERNLPNMVFRMHSSGLHFFDPRKNEFSFVVTVEDNMKPFSKRQIIAAEKARTLLAGMAFPSDLDYKWILRSNQVQECPITPEDARIADKIWGPNVPSLKGKTTRKTPPAVPSDIVEIPMEIRQLHRNVTISIDIFFVNKIPFFLTLSRKICFTTVTHLSNRKTATIFAAFKSIFTYYLQKGFQIVTVTADNEFAPLAEMMYDLPGAPTLNLTSANEHEPYIERRIRVVKERTRAVRHSLPFKQIPVKVMTHMIFFVVKLINYFPAKGGVSAQYSPKTIMSGPTLNYKQCSLPFGTYCQVHEEDGPRNSLAARTSGAISLGPSSNRQGGQLFLSLNTSRVITRRSWTVLPMPQAVIDKVNALAADQPSLITFTDKQGNEIGEETDIITPPQRQSEEYEIPGVVGDIAKITGVDMDSATGDNSITNQKADLGNEPDHNEPPLVDSGTDFDPTTDDSPTDEVTDTSFDESTPAAVSSPPAKGKTPEAFSEPTTQATPTRRSTRERKQIKSYVPSMSGKSYQYAATQLASSTHHPQVVEMILTQLTLKTAINKWGSRAICAAESEMKQLHWRNTFKPVHYSELSSKQKEMILESHIFLTEKRTGEIKGRTVAGGNKQRNYIEKEDASSPTVATESVIITSVVDAKENRHTAVIDVPNAFIQTVVNDKGRRVIIRIRGMLVDILVKIAPDIYEPYVTTDKKGNKQLLVECLNAIYGTMVAGLLYYEKFTNSLKEKGYKMNPYDACVWNKRTDGKQCTICFHVDDCKISHVSEKVVDQTIAWLRRDYESIFEDGSGKMKVSRGKVHKYLGMTLDFTTKGQVEISMIDYVKEVIEAWDKVSQPADDEFTTVLSKRARKAKKTAAPEDLFKIDEDATKLDTKMSTAFHNIVAKALYLVKRARPDASVSIAFLTTRVRAPDVDDWRKLGHLIEYLRSTVDLPLILGAELTGVLNWYVDASFAVHPNMRGHTGGGLSMGRGFPIVCSTKQKINTRSSTESELVGVDDMMSSILWTRYFLKAQGYNVQDNVIFQDNKSSILLERNGKASSSKRTKHINVRYFFITDRISKGEVRVEWCPTKEMVADFMTKPLQGSTFTKFRDLLMGLLPRKEAAKVVTHDSVKEIDREDLAQKDLRHRSVLDKV